MHVFFISACLALLCLEVGAKDYCFAKDLARTQTLQFASKTAYQKIKSMNIEKQSQVKGCIAQKIWIFHRHGTRLPSDRSIGKAPQLEALRDKIVKNYEVLNTAPKTNALCKDDLNALKKWKWDSKIKPEMGRQLTSQGYEDLRGTAKTYMKYYPDVMKGSYDKSRYLFRHTDTQRATESFKAFTQGLFGTSKAALAEKIPEKDLLLRPYDYCKTWQAHPRTEFEKYLKSKIWLKTIEDVSRRLGFKNTLKASDVELMYDICRFEQAWNVKSVSVWCAAFLPEQVAVFEYGDDLKYFYKTGYGYEDNTRLNCRAVQDMAHHLSSTKLPNVVAYFAHSIGVTTLISALGISKDKVPLKADNYEKMTQRKWRTSNIDPFASNLLAVKYQCKADPVEKEKVMFFLNQNAVDFEWCSAGLCNWSEVKKRYSTILNADCNSYYCDDAV